MITSNEGERFQSSPAKQPGTKLSRSDKLSLIIDVVLTINAGRGRAIYKTNQRNKFTIVNILSINYT